MIYKWLTILILLTFCNFISYSQIDGTGKTLKVTEHSEKERIIKEQAIVLLKTNLLEARALENLRQRADVIAEASIALWDFDRVLAEESLLNFVNQTLADYKQLSTMENRTVEEDAKLETLSYALKKILKSLAVKDLEKAKSLQNRFFEIGRQSLKEKRLSKAEELNESFELAAEGLEFDERRTLDLLSAIIQQGIPGDFPKYVFGLKKKNPAVADALTRGALQNLAANPNYKASDAIYLSAVIFNEEIIVMPSLSAADSNNFGVYNYFVENSNKSIERDKIAAYFAAVQNFFDSRLRNQTDGLSGLPQNLIRSYFLIEKLKSYSRTYNLGNSPALDNASATIDVLMQTAGFSQKILADLKGYAQRLVDANNPLDLADGTSLFEKAENARDPNVKLEYLISGVIQRIEFGKFAEAERKIFDVENIEIRSSLYLSVNYRAALEAVRNKNWSEFEKRTEKIFEKDVKAFLYLKAIPALKFVKSNQNLLIEYAVEAEKNIQDISDKTEKANAYAYLTSLMLSSSDQTNGVLLIPSTIKAFNQAPDYSEGEFKIRIKIPTRPNDFIEFAGANSFADIFSMLTESDWNNAQIQALQIKSKGLQAKAQIVVSQTILKQKRR